jgi:eukaryotic-like serine/threonine-protein kinase
VDSCPTENELQAFALGALDAVYVAALSNHLDTCTVCLKAIWALAPGQVEGEENVGRYLLRRELGRGGMGVVYEAFDPELNRIVALKVLRPELASQQQRLQGEAQAMATLSHPNVVTVYDVGTIDERVFLVMERVQGTKLSQWLLTEARTSDAIVAIFLQAAEGLAAAHGAGIVHRDFKPENVLVSHNGRAQVTDFGLAISESDAKRESRFLNEGTAGYMAPEQQRGEFVDARSDQYALCVALEEALRDTPNVSSSLSAIVSRGRKVEPAARWPSVRALLDAILAQKKRARSRKTGLVVTLSLTLLGAAMFWFGGRRANDQRLCDGGEAHVAEVWNEQAKRTLLNAFRSIGSADWQKPHAATARALDAYTQRWLKLQRATCEATRVHGEQSEAALDQKMSCLNERLEHARSLVRVAGAVDATMLEHIPALLDTLPPLESCNETRETLPPPPAERITEVANLRARLAEASATLAAGRYEQGLHFANALTQEADRIHYLPLVAEAALLAGTAHGRLGHAQESERALEQAVSSATAGGARLIAVRAWVQLMHYIGVEEKRYADGFRYSEYANAVLEGLLGVADLQSERLAWHRAMLVGQKHYAQAQEVSEQELALVASTFGEEHRLYASALDGKAGILAGQCRNLDALAIQNRACTILEEQFGESHPQLALCLGNIASLHSALGQHAQALTLKRRALTLFERIPGHPNHVAMAHRNLVRSLTALGQTEEASRALQAATSLSRASDEATLSLLQADLLHKTGKTEEAAQLYARAMAADTAHLRSEPALNLAQLELERKNYIASERASGVAMSTLERTREPTSCAFAHPLHLRAEALMALKRQTEALSTAERAVELLRTAQVDPDLRERIASSLERAKAAQP